MQVRTKKHHTERSIQIHEEVPMSADDAIKKICGDRPQWAVALHGFRYRDGLTQTVLGEMLGVEQTNISKMEQGKRPIGKTIAKRLAKIFKTDYRLFL